MKVAVIFILSLLSFQYSKAQYDAQKLKDSTLKSQYFLQTELKDHFVKYDFSKLFTVTENSQVYGFIGNNFMRIRIKIIKISKNPNISNSYIVFGKSMVKNNILNFRGILVISNIRKVKSMNYGVDDSYKNKSIKGEYAIIGDYQLVENRSDSHSGTFKGIFNSDFYIDKHNNIQYDDININADGYTNNQFVGNWTSYNTGEIKKMQLGRLSHS